MKFQSFLYWAALAGGLVAARGARAPSLVKRYQRILSKGKIKISTILVHEKIQKPFAKTGAYMSFHSILNWRQNFNIKFEGVHNPTFFYTLQYRNRLGPQNVQKLKKFGRMHSAAIFSYQRTISAKILQQSKEGLGPFLLSNIFDFFVVCCLTQEKALIKISAHLVKEKNCKVHRQNTRGSRTVF